MHPTLNLTDLFIILLIVWAAAMMTKTYIDYRLDK